MAVVERKRKSGSVFYVVFEWEGKQVWERVGSRKREAEILDRKRKAEVKAGTYIPESGKGKVTLKAYAKRWSAPRANAYADDERALLRRHIYSRPWLADMDLDKVRPKHVDRLIAELRETLSDKSVSNVLGVVKLIYNSAIREELATVQPVVLRPRELKRAPTTEREIYTATEALILTRHHAIPWPIRVLNALCLFAGLREGEACGRRWRDLDDSCGPLAALVVRDQYGGQPLKTERPRVVPVHPELLNVLRDWASEGFELYTGRKPQTDDFIVPNVSSRAKHPHHTRSSYYKAFTRYAEAAGVRPRSLHSTRHTFISLCRRGGARKDVLERVTHNARGDIVDRYTRFDWAPLCDAVRCLNLDVHLDVHPLPGNPGDSGPRLLGPGNGESQGTPELATASAGFDSPRLHSSAAVSPEPFEARQGSRQELEVTDGNLRASNRARKRALLSLQEADPNGARVGLALCRGLDAAYDCDLDEVEQRLGDALDAHGGELRPVPDAAIGGGR